MQVNEKNLGQSCHRTQGNRENSGTFQTTGAATTEPWEDTVPRRAETHGLKYPFLFLSNSLSPCPTHIQKTDLTTEIS